jgi:hypothetical protein
MATARGIPHEAVKLPLQEFQAVSSVYSEYVKSFPVTAAFVGGSSMIGYRPEDLNSTPPSPIEKSHTVRTKPIACRLCPLAPTIYHKPSSFWSHVQQFHGPGKDDTTSDGVLAELHRFNGILDKSLLKYQERIADMTKRKRDRESPVYGEWIDNLRLIGSPGFTYEHFMRMAFTARVAAAQNRREFTRAEDGGQDDGGA